MLELLPILVDSLSSGDSVALSMVVDRHGSLPMARCAKMAVLADGSIRGTVGGGCLEAEVWAVGQRLIEDGGCSLDTFHLNEVEEGLGGHVCGGTVTILSRVLRPTDRTREMVDLLRRRIEAEQPVLVLSGLPSADGFAADPGWAVAPTDAGPITDGMDVDRDALVRCHEATESGRAALLQMHGTRVFAEPLTPSPVALVFGAGHCGRAIGRAAAAAGFRVRIMDDRAPFVEADGLEWAERREVVDFACIGESMDIRPHHHVVIVTRGHEHDLVLLRQLAGSPAAYLGMIGSRRKRALFERTLRAEGLDGDALRRMRSPMGLPIGADTPEEIAVAVVGEMIAVRRGATASVS